MTGLGAEYAFEGTPLDGRVAPIAVVAPHRLQRLKSDPKRPSRWIRVSHFGEAADGWNSGSPAIVYAPIAAWPSGEVSHSASCRAAARFASGCFTGSSRMTL